MALKTSTLTAYGQRIARAMALIARDPAAPPRLEALADAAAFSPFHFHRIYRALTGETPAETAARERLSRAAMLLIRGRAPVAEVARRCGYGSAAALTRAFRAAYGVPPGAYRAQGGIGFDAPRPPIHPLEETSMTDVTIRDLPPLRLLALRHRGPYGNIGDAFNRLMAVAGGMGLAGPDTRSFGLYHDDPMSVPASSLRSDAAVTIGPDVAAPDGLAIIEMPALRVAVRRFQGPYSELEGAWSRLYRDWLPASGEEPADAPCMEEYVNDCRQLPPSEWLTDLMVPLRGKG